jgi:hypothetical protein
MFRINDSSNSGGASLEYEKEGEFEEWAHLNGYVTSMPLKSDSFYVFLLEVTQLTQFDHVTILICVVSHVCPPHSLQDRSGERVDYEFALTAESDSDNSNVFAFVSEIANACASRTQLVPTSHESPSTKEKASIEENLEITSSFNSSDNGDGGSLLSAPPDDETIRYEEDITDDHNLSTDQNYQGNVFDELNNGVDTMHILSEDMADGEASSTQNLMRLLETIETKENTQDVTEKHTEVRFI